MLLTPVNFGSAQPIEGYGPGFFRVAGHLMRGALVVTPWSASPWGGLDDLTIIDALAGRIDVILLGSGANIAPVPPVLRRAIEAAGIGVEPMSSPAACRTYNVLLGEGRRVAAALLPVAG